MITTYKLKLVVKLIELISASDIVNSLINNLPVVTNIFTDKIHFH